MGKTTTLVSVDETAAPHPVARRVTPTSSSGTYTVRASQADGVGDAGSATTTFTVTTASSSGDRGGNGTRGNGTSGTDPRQGPAD